jgi:thiamine biosynthesis protein ThiS
MKLVVNGQEKEVPERLTARGLLESLGVAAEAVVVERNEEVVPRSRLDEVALQAGDRIEIIQMIAGG